MQRGTEKVTKTVQEAIKCPGRFEYIIYKGLISYIHFTLDGFQSMH